MLCSLARPIRPYRTFLFVASQIGREEVRVANRSRRGRYKPGPQETENSRTSSQASSPPRIAPTQLPSSRALPIGVIIWYIDLLETPSLTQGTSTP